MKVNLIALIITAYYVAISKAQILTKATAPPCCRNLLGTQTCLYMNKMNSKDFLNRCNNEIDFRVLQCCELCDTIASTNIINNIPQTYDNAVQRMLLTNGTGFCFDRMSVEYCQKFVAGTGPWHRTTTWSCEAQYAHLAFRICRLSCGYCAVDNVNPATVPIITYTQANAYASCNLLE